MQTIKVELRIERQDGATITYNVEKELYLPDYMNETIKDHLDSFLKTLEEEIQDKWDD